MDNRQRRTVTSFKHIVSFLEQHRVTPEPTMLAGMRSSLAASVNRLESLSQEQFNARNALRGDITRVTNKLRRDRMLPLARIAKPALAFAPSAESALRVPHARASTYEIATAARRMVALLMRQAKVLCAAGVSKDFVAQFKSEAEALALKARDTRAARQRLTRATSAIAAELTKARRTRSVLDGLVQLHLGKDKVLIHAWRRESRISARIGRPRKRQKPAPILV